ncbi:MAG: hypothetical protein R3E10_09095 [Gemmatimonadota bacterium]
MSDMGQNTERGVGRSASEPLAAAGRAPGGGVARVSRVAWTFVSVLAVETLVVALALALPGMIGVFALEQTVGSPYERALVLALIAVPAFLLFTLGLMVWSALATRALGWRTPPNVSLPLAELSWPLLDWARGMVLQHFTRLFAGAVWRASPVWTFYLRLNGARIGRRVYVNTLSIVDHSLLSIGEGTVIGSDVHMGGHWVERGAVHTARTTIGRDVTIGNGSVVGIGVTIGDGAQVGALCVVPKSTHIEAGAVYLGVARPSGDRRGAADSD